MSERATSWTHAVHALRIDLVPRDAPGAAGVAIELDLASGRSLVRRLQEIIAAAERAENH